MEIKITTTRNGDNDADSVTIRRGEDIILLEFYDDGGIVCARSTKGGKTEVLLDDPIDSTVEKFGGGE